MQLTPNTKKPEHAEKSTDNRDLYCKNLPSDLLSLHFLPFPTYPTNPLSPSTHPNPFQKHLKFILLTTFSPFLLSLPNYSQIPITNQPPNPPGTSITNIFFSKLENPHT